MGIFTVINNSTFTDYSAILRVGFFLAGDEYYATHDEHGKKVVSIKKQENNKYIIIDSD